MPYQAYSHDIDTYDLSQGHSLHRAQNHEFIKAWVVYRNLNEDFTQSFAARLSELDGVPFCFWVQSDAKRVAGLVMLPNGIGDFFLIPPEQDAALIVTAVMPLLDHWSDSSKPIGAQAIATAYLDAFQQAGFSLQESRFWMIRPTAQINSDWTAEWRVSSLNPEQPEALASLLEASFSGGVGQYGTRDFEAHLKSVNNFFEDYTSDSACGQASAMIINKQTNEFAGLCMVDMHNHLPAIRFVAVHPDYQRRGLATNLLKRAICQLEPHHDWVKLAVSIDNPAVSVYRQLGFLESDTLHQLVKPPQLS